MLSMMLLSKDGAIWDISNVVCDITWKTSRIGKPGSLEFTLVKGGLFQDAAFAYANGDAVRFHKDGTDVFLGYIFSIDSGRAENVKIMCYDQIRYLLFNSGYSFVNKTATEILRQIADDFRLKLGTVDDTVYKIPTMHEDNTKLLDIICKALDHTLIGGYGNYVLFDDFGSLTLRNIRNLYVPVWIGNESLMTDYSTKRSIDSDTYNFIVLYRDNKELGKREYFVAEDEANIKKWGFLQLYQSVDENKNKAQIEEMLSQLKQLKNRESQSLSVEAMGDLRIRAGCFLSIVIEEAGINQAYLIDECQHKFDGADHTMSLELKVV